MQRWAWPALGLFVLACFWGFWSYGPFDLDEGLYAVALMEMQERGDWVVPTYRGVPFFEKPILFYWTAWLADLAGAEGVVALRLPSILATIGTLALVALFTKRIGPVMILSVSVLFMGVGRMFMPDPFLVFGMTAALFAFWKSREDPRWFVAAGVGLAVAVLAKGPMPLVVFGLLGVYCRWRTEWPPDHERSKPMVHAWKLAGVALFLVIAAPWYVLAAMRSPAFVDEFLIKQNLGRLAGADVVHAGPFWLYIPVVLVGLLPFSLSLVGAWRGREGELEQYLWAFALIVFVLFSVAGTKLPHYILPIFPALAILIDNYLERERPRVIAACFVCMLALTVLLVGLGFADDRYRILVVFGGMALGGATTCVNGRLQGWHPTTIGFAAIGALASGLVAAGPRIYWSATHEDSYTVARSLVNDKRRIVEYRTGGERARGKTSHPSMQWMIGRNTEAVEDLFGLRAVISREPVIVITRDNRLEQDLRGLPSSFGDFQRLFQVGEFEVFIASPINHSNGRR
ncbi:MAG: glycosyltransferase family 39 protein [Armatimonadota bacterium]|nr:glycosyltransferase family 39 protein [Armatimonadota bacterium]